jgi:omega-6 fatty acid desaturase (delta-12 desaturase)
VPGPIEANRLGCKAAALGFQVPIPRTPALQFGTTFMPLLCLLGVMHVGLTLGWWPVLGLGLPAAGFVMRVFALQHDCGRGSLFRSRRVNDAVARFCSLFTMTPKCPSGLPPRGLSRCAMSWVLRATCCGTRPPSAW